MLELEGCKTFKVALRLLLVEDTMLLMERLPNQADRLASIEGRSQAIYTSSQYCVRQRGFHHERRAPRS